MLRCPACGRMGGPFLAGPQAHIGRQLVRTWFCHCCQRFHAVAGAERTSGPHAVYSGFVVESEGRSQPVVLRCITRDSTHWQIGSLTLTIALAADSQGRWQLSITRQKEPTPLFEGRVAPATADSTLSAFPEKSGKLFLQEVSLLKQALLRITGSDR